MQALIDVRESGAYLLMSVGGSGALRRHLAEMGLVVGKKVTVVQPASKLSGMVIFFKVSDYQLAMKLPRYSWFDRLPWMLIPLPLPWLICRCGRQA